MRRSVSTFCLLIHLNQFNPNNIENHLEFIQDVLLHPFVMHACRHSCLQLCDEEVVCVRLTFDTVSAGTGEQNLDNRWMVVRVPFRVTYTESDLSTVASSWWNRKHVILRFVSRSPMMSCTHIQSGFKTCIALLCFCPTAVRTKRSFCPQRFI